ncbi:MAG: 4Fe-4S dicluster domain-containing protein [Gallionellaceae bacterium]|nr:4Fe-4S dicluster domain-containing protein [Gallionellaceae bacterium]MDD5364465.1 4Fe-4S dicluster domain-containing protein [Gallionellaceae bacterium]MDD5367288.1 4Fe-4S dicluster domain-containing protein [Gallionellaceae bacterium]
MSDMNQQMTAKYKNNFLKEIEEQAEMGDWVKMCMQCGVCSGSCPTNFHPGWDHPPQEIFMLIRAGKRDEVLNSQSMWMCTSCYNCYVRCPRKIPITHIMHGIAEYAYRIGRAPKNQPTLHLSQTFWNNCTKNGRVNEVQLTQTLYFKDGIADGIKKAMAMQAAALGLVKAGRLNPMEALGGGHKCKDIKGIHAMLAKAKELEAKRKGRTA